MKFQGILTALVTPMDEQFQVDEAKLRQLVNIQIDSGIHGLVMLGGTGEYAALSAEERQRAVRRRPPGRMLVCGRLLEGTGSRNLPVFYRTS